MISAQTRFKIAPEANFTNIKSLNKLNLPSLPVLKGEKDWEQ
jgi:hypothetical protein